MAGAVQVRDRSRRTAPPGRKPSGFSAAGLRDTRPRRVLAELIAARDGCFTAADLEREIRERRVRVGRATVFRTLDLLVGAGAIERIDLPSGGHAYVRCEPAQHHHHAVCVACGRAVGFSAPGLDAAFHEAARSTGFELVTHRLEFYGRCGDCR